MQSLPLPSFLQHPLGKIGPPSKFASRHCDFLHKTLLLYRITPITHSARQCDRDFRLLCFRFSCACWESLGSLAQRSAPPVGHSPVTSEKAQDLEFTAPPPACTHLFLSPYTTRHTRPSSRTRLSPGLFDAAEHLTGICPSSADFLQRC